MNTTVNTEKVVQNYGEKTLVFKVEQRLKALINGVSNTSTTTFYFEVYCHKKKENSNIVVIKKNNVVCVPLIENNFLALLEQLENLTYPVAVETNEFGDFIKFIEHKDWLANWEKKAQKIIDTYDGAEEIKNIKNRYYDIIKNEKDFIKNKFKEPYWNLFFFNPAFDREGKTVPETTINWHVKSLGTLSCKGEVQRTNSGSKEITTLFTSLQTLDEDTIKNSSSFPEPDTIDWQKQKAQLQIESTFDVNTNRYKNKKAVFEWQYSDHLYYIEETKINFEKLVDKS